MKKRSPVIPFIAPTAPTRVPLTAREKGEVSQQRALAHAEVARLRRIEIDREIERLVREREELSEEPSSDDGPGDEGDIARDIERDAIAEEGAAWDEFDMPDWDSEDFFDEWGDDIDYEIFTVLS